MLIKLFIILSLISIFIIGYLRLKFLLDKLTDRLNFIFNYRSKFIDLANSGSTRGRFFDSAGFDYETYNWLTLNVVKAQRLMGRFAIGEFIAPFNRFHVKNYEFVVETIGKFQEGHLTTQEIAMLDNILLRRIGFYQEFENELKHDLRNPLKWFRAGIAFLLDFPFLILNWFGIIRDTTFDSITSNFLYRFITGMVALLSFLGTIVTLITGWSSFKLIVTNFAYKIFH